MSYEFDTSAATFDRSELRTLRAAYAQALASLEVSRVVDEQEKMDLAKLVIHLGRDRILEGTGLKYPGAGDGVADEASSFLNEMHGVALCA